MTRLRTILSVLAAALLVLGAIGTTSPASAQSLEERVERLEQQLDEGDELPADRYVDEFGGRLQADWTFNVDESDNYSSQLGNNAADGFEFRRLWLYTAGSVAPNVDYKVQVGLAGGNASVKDAYINLTDLPVLPHLKIGQFKQPFSINELTSSKYITFLSRSNVTGAFSQGRNPGFLTSDQLADGKLNYAVGVFTPNATGETAPLTNGSYNLSARVTSPVMANDDFSKLVHLGLALSHRGQASGNYVNGVGPEVSNGGPNLLALGLGSVESSDVVGLELATVHGPLSVQGEYSEATINRQDGFAEPDLSSYYLMASYFLTGEKRPYDAASGSFGRVSPNDPYTGSTAQGSGPGAWEVAARFSSTDFTAGKGLSGTIGLPSGSPAGSRTALAGEADVATVGLNWYPTSHTRWMLNYVDAQQDDADVDAQWINTRFQVDF